MRFLVVCILFVFTACFAANAQQDSLPATQPVVQRASIAISADSAAKIQRGAFLADSIALSYIFPDSARTDQFIAALLNNNIADVTSFAKRYVKKQAVLKTGVPRKQRGPWIIASVIGLLIYTALLNFFLGDDIRSIFRMFYKKNARSQFDKEGGVISLWAVIGLFILFCLASGLVLYQLTLYSNNYYTISGFQLFVSLSVTVSLLFALKYVMLKFIGFIFDVNKLVTQYIAVLNLTYFNIGFVLLFASICLSMLSGRFLPLLKNFTLIMMAVVFAWQYLLNSVSIISNFRFHKFYLFIYLCALEICPILILIKALDI